MKKKDRDPRFQTHIAEPRWQQIASLLLALAIAAGYLWVIFFSHK
jgi:hypothetical protein